MAMLLVQGTNALILGSGIQILEEALSKALVEGVTTPSFIEELDVKVLKNLVKTAKTVHDQKLDRLVVMSMVMMIMTMITRWGDRTSEHSTNPLPYSPSLARKKKFLKNVEKKETGIKLGSPDLASGQETYQYMELCKGRDLRPPSVTSRLYCM